MFAIILAPATIIFPPELYGHPYNHGGSITYAKTLAACISLNVFAPARKCPPKITPATRLGSIS